MKAGRPETTQEPLVVIDGDDTLWSVEPLYDRARSRAGEIAAEGGVPTDEWDPLERTLDIANVRRFGLSRQRFPTSCVEAYQTLVRQQQKVPDPEVSERIRRAASEVYRQTAPLVKGAVDLLEWFRPLFRVALLTQGDPLIQRMRIRSSGLVQYFDKTLIVARKTSASFHKLIEWSGINPAGCWSVGNSLASDINPALRCGMSAVWIDAHVWEYERREIEPIPGRLFRVNALSEIPLILQPAISVGMR